MTMANEQTAILAVAASGASKRSSIAYVGVKQAVSGYMGGTSTSPPTGKSAMATRVTWRS
mgnify:CR=1 FL=1